MMRLAYLTGEFPRKTDTFIQREIKQLRTQQVQLFVYSIRRPGFEQAMQDNDLTFQTTYLIPDKIHILLVNHLYFIIKSPRLYLRALRLGISLRPKGWRRLIFGIIYFLEAGLLAYELRDKDIEHLHNHFAGSSCNVAAIAACMVEIPFSFSLHGPTAFMHAGEWNLSGKIQAACFVRCISYYCRSQAMLWSDPMCWDKLKIIHCGIEVQKYSPAIQTDHSTLKQTERILRLIFVGRLARVKGAGILLDLILRLVKQKFPVELTVVGSGPDEDFLKQLAIDFKCSEAIHFVGYANENRIASMLQNHNALVMSSLAEGLPVVLMEALASGIFCIAPGIDGIPEILRNAHLGSMYPPGDGQALERCLRQTLWKLEAGILHDTDISLSRHIWIARNFDIQRVSARMLHYFSIYNKCRSQNEISRRYPSALQLNRKDGLAQKLQITDKKQLLRRVS